MYNRIGGDLGLALLVGVMVLVLLVNVALVRTLGRRRRISGDTHATEPPHGPVDRDQRD